MVKSKSVGCVMLVSLIMGGPHVWAEESNETPSENPAVRLESTFVGDKEQPAVSYFIPWQGTSTPDKLQWSLENKHDATLQPVDRDVLQRSINIYREMKLEND